jgi:hypothetical protein
MMVIFVMSVPGVVEVFLNDFGTSSQPAISLVCGLAT